MAILVFQVTSLSRAAGRSAPAAAAYRAGERLRDEGRGQVYNHARRSDIEHREILVPSGRAAEVPDWVRDRGRLWNAAESVETRANARVAREYMIGLPSELGRDARVDLARRFAQDLADRYGTAVDLAAHEPRPAGDPRNYHAHLLATTRVLTPQGLGAKAVGELNDSRRRELGLLSSREEIRALRAHWAQRANEALLVAGFEPTLDPRTLKAQGIDRQPRPQLPMAVVQMERRGIATQFVKALNEAEQTRAAAVRPTSLIVTPERVLTIDERQALARERWLAYRNDNRTATRGPTLDRGDTGLERNARRISPRHPGLEWGD